MNMLFHHQQHHNFYYHIFINIFQKILFLYHWLDIAVKPPDMHDCPSVARTVMQWRANWPPRKAKTTPLNLFQFTKEAQLCSPVFNQGTHRLTRSLRVCVPEIKPSNRLKVRKLLPIRFSFSWSQAGNLFPVYLFIFLNLTLESYFVLHNECHKPPLPP